MASNMLKCNARLDLRLRSNVIKYRKLINGEDAIDPRFNIDQQDSSFSWSKFGSLTFSFLLVTDCQATKANLSHLQPFSPRTCPNTTRQTLKMEREPQKNTALSLSKNSNRIKTPKYPLQYNVLVRRNFYFYRQRYPFDKQHLFSHLFFHKAKENLATLFLFYCHCLFVLFSYLRHPVKQKV